MEECNSQTIQKCYSSQKRMGGGGRGEREKKTCDQYDIKTVHFLNQQTKNRNKVGINHRFIKEEINYRSHHFAVLVSFSVQIELPNIETILNRSHFIYMIQKFILNLATREASYGPQAKPAHDLFL